MKYKLTKETKEVYGLKLFRIEALKDFGDVEKGEKGGWIEKEENLSQENNAWIYGNARVYGNAEIYGNASVYGDARVYGNASVYGNAEIYGNASVYGNARVYGNASVYGDAEIYGKKLISGYFYHTKEKSEKIEIMENDEDYETLYSEPKYEEEGTKKQELLKNNL